jgi:Cu+-exporting ATPase
MDSLVSMGSAAAVIYGVVLFFAAGEALGRGDLETVSKCTSNLYFESAAMILTLVTVGKLLEARAKGKTGRALEKLIDLSPKTAHVIRDGREVEVDASTLMVGDIIVLRPGESVPADGVILEGQSSFDRSALTGESVPVDLSVGDEVTTASVNISGYVRFRATRVGDETTLSRIIGLVRDAGATKAPVARLADKISGIFVPTVMIIATVATVVWLIISRDVGFSLSIGISILVV